MAEPDQHSYVNETVRIRDLTGDPPGAVRDSVFFRCQIVGPAVIVPSSADVDFSGCDFDGTPETSLWITGERDEPDGAIPVQRCRFISCTFRGIEISGRRVDLERLGFLERSRPVTPQPGGAMFPAVCEQCGTTFSVRSPIALDSGGSVLALNNWAGPCPACGATGRIPSGLYEFAAAAVPIVEQASQTEREALLEAVQALLGQLASRDEVVEVFETTPGPWKKLVGALTSSEASALYGLLSVLLTILFRYV